MMTTDEHDGASPAFEVSRATLRREAERDALMAVLDNGSRPYTLAPQSLTFDPDVSYEDWLRCTDELIAVARGAPFWLADALSFGEDTFSERAAAVFPDQQWAWQTMANWAWTSKAVPPERRHAALSFSHHGEVASLPAPQQEVMLTLAEEQGWTSADLREQVRKAKRTAARTVAAAQPVPEINDDDTLVLEASALQMPLEDGSVDLIVTSPPYGLMKPYRNHGDTASGWPEFIGDFCVEAYRVAKGGGRMCINVPLDTTLGGFRPTYAQTVLAALAANWTYRCTVAWLEPNVSKSIARGSVDSPSAPHVIAPCEMIAVFSKGDWKRDPEGLTVDIDHEEWLEWTNGVWALQGESRPWEGFEAAYPTDVPYRLIRLLSFQEDVVLDPFAGSGTTLVVGRRLGRSVIGFDNDPKQIESIKRRLAARNYVSSLT